MKQFFTFCILFLLLSQSSHAQQVTNVRDVQQGENIQITYDLVGNNGIEQFTVALYVSLDGGQNWQGPLSQVSGDVGSNIRTGQSKTILWKVLEEFDDLQGSNIVFKVDASYTPSRFEFEPEMVFVEGGTFMMGSDDPEADPGEKPVHSVTLSDFYIGKYEVTNAQFCAFLNEMGNQTEGGNEWVFIKGDYRRGAKCQIVQIGNRFGVEHGYEDHPINYVSWYGARAFCNWLKKKTGKNFQLPTEAQWEFAARGGNKSRGFKYAGSDNLDLVAWYGGNSDENIYKVGQKAPNELGIFDMSGNVHEWCLDKRGGYNSDSLLNPSGPLKGLGGVITRGGSWTTPDRGCRVTARGSDLEELRSTNIGFRVVLY